MRLEHDFGHRFAVPERVLLKERLLVLLILLRLALPKRDMVYEQVGVPSLTIKCISWRWYCALCVDSNMLMIRLVVALVDWPTATPTATPTLVCARVKGHDWRASRLL
jgi:hypothetical protein